MTEKHANANLVKRNEDGTYNTTKVLGDLPEGCYYVITGVYATSSHDMGFTWRDDTGAKIVPGTWWGKNLVGIDVHRAAGLLEHGGAISCENPTLGDIALSVTYRLEEY